MKHVAQPVLFRVARLFVLAIGLAGAWPGIPSFAEEKTISTKKEEPKPQVELPPEGEKKMAEFLKKASAAKRKLWDEQMAKEIANIVKVTGLGPEGKQALEKSAQEIADNLIKDWSGKMDGTLRKRFGRQPAQIMAILDQFLPQVDLVVRQNYWLGVNPGPLDNDAWAAALRRTLTAGQIAAWTKDQEERKRQWMAESGDLLKSSAERVRDQNLREILSKGTAIKLALQLPKDRAEALDNLAKKIADESCDVWLKQAEKIMGSMEDAQRKLMLKQRQGLYIAMDEKDTQDQWAKWNEGIGKLLSAEEMKRWQAMQVERKARRVRALGQMMLVLLDKKIAFTASQRAQLEPIAGRLVEKRDTFFADPGMYGASFLPQEFFSAGTEVDGAEIPPLLDAIQWKHWQEACDPKNIAEMPVNFYRQAAPPPDIPKSPSQNTEAEDVENAISDFLQEKAVKEKKRVLAINVLKVEDATRIAGLPAAACDKLQAAARGATENYMVFWKAQTEQTVRNVVREPTPRNVRQQLAGIQEYYFRQNFDRMGAKSNILDESAKAEMSESQQAAWKKELEERSAYEDRAICSFLLAEFDRNNPLSEEQWQKLGEALSGVIKVYGKEISVMFSSSNSIPWYLQSYRMNIPFAGVPEKDLKAILSKQQLETWISSNGYANSISYWQNIQERHDRSVK